MTNEQRRQRMQHEEDRARIALEELAQAKRLTIHRTWVADDGWLCGWDTLWAVAEEPIGQLVKLHWHDGNGEFFESLPSGGSAPYRLQVGRPR